MASTLSELKEKEELALREWRMKHQFAIMEANRKVLEDMRDLPQGKKKVKCPHCSKWHEIDWASPGAINKAVETLSKMVSGLQPDKVSATDPALQRVAVQGELSDAELQEIERLANGGDEWENTPEEDSVL